MTSVVQLTMLGIAALYLSVIIFQGIKGGNTRVFVGSMATLLFFELCGLCYFLHALMEISYGNLWIIRGIAGALYLLGQLSISMLLTFIIRLDFVFKSSLLQISNSTVKLLYYSWTGLIIFGFLALLGNEKSVTLVLVFGPLWILLYIALSVKLVALFVGKLKVFMVQKSLTPTAAATATAVSTTKSVIDMELLSVAIKNGMLATIAIVSSVFFTILLFVMRVVPRYDMAQLLVIDTCLYLLFASNGYIYNKLCFRCHGTCEKWQLDGIKETKVNETITETKSYSMDTMDATGSATIVVSVQSDKTRSSLMCQYI